MISKAEDAEFLQNNTYHSGEFPRDLNSIRGKSVLLAVVGRNPLCKVINSALFD